MPSGSHKFLLRIVRFGIIFVIVATALALPLLFAPHSRWTNDLIINSALFYNRAVEFPKMMPGRHSSCSVSDAWFESVTYRESVTTREIADRMRVLQNDGELVQLDTPAGPFWIPARDRPTLPEMLAEQQRDVYGTGEHDVHPGDVVLDCGANVGVFTRRALKRGAKLVVAKIGRAHV